MTELTEDRRGERSKKRMWLRILAVILAAVMLLSLFVLDAVRIKLRRDATTATTSAAADALAEDSEYINASTSERLSEWLSTVLSSPESFEDYYQIATILIAQGEYRRALVNINESIRLYDGSERTIWDELYMKQGGLYAMLGEYAAMEESFTHVTAESDYYPQALLLIAQAAIETGETDKAIQNLEAYVGYMPAATDMLLALGQLYVVKEEYESAADAYGRAMEGYDDAGGTLHFLRGSCYMEIQEYALAYSDFQEALARGYEDASLCAAQCSLCSFLCGEYALCLEYGEDALEQPSAEVSLPDLKYYMGISAMTLEEYETAADYLTAVTELDETRHDAAYYIAVCSMALGDYRGAIERLTALIEQGYDLTYCYYNRAVCYIERGSYGLARGDLKMVVELNENEELVTTAKELLRKL